MEDAVMDEQPIEEIPLINRGFTRVGVPTATQQGIPTHPADYYRTLVFERPWEQLQWWESPLQARAGIEWLTAKPFLRLTTPFQKVGLYPTRVLYPYALRTGQPERIEHAALTVASSVRQAREMYLAAATAGVTDLGRPLLYFYGAHALAKAAVAALFGAEKAILEDSHGLTRFEGPSAKHEHVEWPTIIRWKGKGLFAMLYRATRWDELYRCCYDDSPWKARDKQKPPDNLEFHVLECIRYLQYDWGILPHTGFASHVTPLGENQASQFLLLPYHRPNDQFATRQTLLNTPRIEAPRVLVIYMLLYHFSILARYNPVAWQKLLAADQELEGYVFRSAMERAAQDFLQEMIRLLPLVRPSPTFAPETWSDARPVLSDWYRAPREVVTTRPEGSGHFITVYYLKEWAGSPRDACVKAQPLMGTQSTIEGERDDSGS